MPEPAGGASPTTVLLRVTREARDVFGNVRSEAWEELRAVPPGVAGPGAPRESRLSVE